MSRLLLKGILQQANIEPEIHQYISGLTVPLSWQQVKKLNRFVRALKNGLGISRLSEYFDIMYVLAGETQESSLRNIVKNSHHATAVNSPTFYTNDGVLFNGTNNYITTNYKPHTDGVNYTQDNASMGVHVRNEGSYGNYMAMGARESTTKYVNIVPISNVTYMQYETRINSGANPYTQDTVSDGTGLLIVTRNGSSETSLYSYRNTTKYSAKSGITGNTTGKPDRDIYIGARNNDGTPGNFLNCKVSFAFAGKHIDDTANSVIYSALNNYLTDGVITVTEPTLIINFDDGGDNFQTVVKPYFISIDKKFTLYSCVDFIDEDGRMSLAVWNDLYDSGFDIQCHSKTHTDFRTLTDAQIKSELDYVNSFFVSNGLPIPKYHGYPYGYRNDSVKASVRTRRKICRRAGNIGIIKYIMDRMDIPTAYELDSLSTTTHLNTLKSIVDNIKATNALGIFYGHQVYVTSPDEVSYPTPTKFSIISDIVDYAIAQGVSIKSMSEFFDNIL